MTVYAETADVEAYLSEEILAEITAATGSVPDSAVISDCLTAASRRIDFFLGARTYTTAETEALKDPCCRIAVVVLCRRVNVAKSFPWLSDDVKELEDDLRAIAAGERGAFGEPVARSVSTTAPSWGSETIYFDGTVT